MKQLTYWHANLRNANKTELWSGNDNEQDWHDILEKSKINYLNESQKKDLEHYIKNPIKYKLNNYGFRTYDNWTVTVINDENFSARNTMMKWMRGMAGFLDGSRSTITDPLIGKRWFDGDATVKQLSTAGKVIQKYKFDYLWPTEIAGIPVDWASDALEEYTVTFAYDFWEHST